MNEIEKDERIWEIEEYIKEYEKRDSEVFFKMEIIAYKRVKFLLISLETSQQAREILRKNIEKVQDWGDLIEKENEELKISLEKAQSIEQIGQHPLFKAANRTLLTQAETIRRLSSELEKEKETILQLREAWRMQDELWKKEKERASEAEFLRDGMQDRCNELFLENERLKERVGELERKVKNLIATISEDLSEDRQNLESCLEELKEAVEKHKKVKNEILGSNLDPITESAKLYKNDEELYKVLEKLSGNL